MKQNFYLGCLILCISVACHTVSDDKKEEHMNNGKIASSAIRAIDSSKLIVPGVRAGKLYLGQDMTQVADLLGSPDDGDAAMGSALGIWYTKSSSDVTRRDPISIFSSYRDSNMVVKVVKQLSVSAADFRTSNGIHTGFTLNALQSAYPGLKKIQQFISGNSHDTLKVYDSVKEGIAFDIIKDTCSAITVHPKNKPANSTYLSVHPGWKNAY
jgi:hypothetical protein